MLLLQDYRQEKEGDMGETEREEVRDMGLQS